MTKVLLGRLKKKIENQAPATFNTRTQAIFHSIKQNENQEPHTVPPRHNPTRHVFALDILVNGENAHRHDTARYAP